jgi:chromosome segregation ATPase
VLKEEYEEEERQRKDAEYRRRQEKLESVRRRVLSMEESPEEYNMMLEKQIRALENKCSDFESVSGELKLTKQRLADEVEHTKKLTKALDDTTENLNNLKIEYAAEVKRLEEEHEMRIRALTEQYEAEISNIKAEHEQLVAEMTERYESELAELRTAHATEIISLNEQHAEKIGALESKHEAEISAERENHSRELAERDVNIAALINNVAIVKADMERAADEFEKEKAELLKENERLVEDKRVANANIYLLRGEKGQESEDFTSQMSFDELERTYHAFTKFYKEQWRMTKKAIRKDLLKAKEAKKDGDANES